jgi:outer membrane protein TolC
LNKSYWQNTASLNATVPILEFGRTKNQAAAQKLLAEASESQSVQALDDLLMNWHKAHDQYSALRDEEQLDQISVAETAKIATLRYASYKYGGSTILDVETADINALGARVSASLRRTQILIQLATLSSLSEMGDKNER